MKKSTYQYELDVLRIMGAISIVLFHYTFRGYAADNMSILSFPFLGEIFKYGCFGIFIFSILSEYTIILSSRNKNFFDFLYSRVLRLYPSFWIAVCITSIAALLFESDQYHVDLKQFFLNLTMLGDYIGVPPVDGAYWFLFVIIKFYFIVSLIILLNLMRFQKYIAGIWLALSLITLFYDGYKIYKFLIMPGCSSFLISGMIFCAAKQEGWDIYKIIVQITSFTLSLYTINNYTHFFNKYFSTDMSLYIMVLIITFIYLLMYILTIKYRYIVLPGYVITLSASTYPLYLIHQNFGFMIFNHFGESVNKYIMLSATSVFMIFLSISISKYLDPLLRKLLIRIIPYKLTKNKSS